MYGVIGQQSPAQVYNAAFNACVQGIAASRNPSNMSLGTEVTGFAPGGGAKCMIAESADPAPPADSDDIQEPKPQEGNAEANIEWAKSIVLELIEGFAEGINSLMGQTLISEPGIRRATRAVHDADFGDTGQCPSDLGSRTCVGSTSPDGTKITMDENWCMDAVNCVNGLMHEALHSAFGGSVEDQDFQHAIIGSHVQDIVPLYNSWIDSQSVQSCLPEDMTCTGSCTSREAAVPDCVGSATTAYVNRLREMGRAAKDCATDACWNPARDDTASGQQCGAPDKCRGQSVALCTEDQPNCMCRNTDRGIDLGATLRENIWQAYCTRAQDERCAQPSAPGGFAGSSPPPSGPRPPSAGTPASRSGVVLGGGRVAISADGTVALGHSTVLAGSTDAACASPNCRASQRGDW
ncbi:MAG: hypothetical protein WCE79_06475 [Xanthobacteraceae bacterium]